jgi:hypothetical protein
MSDDQNARAPNRALLEEVTQVRGWFRAKKTRPIWVKVLEIDQEIATLEGVQNAKRGDCLCRGVQGELWPQSCASLAERYAATDELDTQGWRKHEPRPDGEGVLAAQIDHEFTIDGPWGTLHGKPGDFVIKNYADKDTADPQDVWLVDQRLFKATYDSVSEA